MSRKGLSRRFLLRGAGAALALARIDAMPKPELYGVGALLDGSGIVPIRTGEFWMGSENGNADERPVHRVRIGGFEMSKFEVTQAQWQTVMMDPHSKAGDARATPLGSSVSSDPSHFKDPFLPVDSVSWDDIQVFLKRMDSRDAKHTYRLPSEAEWEYASRVGTTGDDPAMHPRPHGSKTTRVNVRNRLDKNSRTLGDCTIWTETSPNGWPIGTRTTTMQSARLPIQSGRLKGHTASIAAAVGLTMRNTVVPLCAVLISL